MASVSRFLTDKLRLKVIETKSAVARPEERKFLGFSFTAGRKPRRRLAPQAIDRFQARVRALTRRTGGQSLPQVAKELSSYEGPDEPDPDVVYLDDNRDGDGYRSYRDCYRPPYLFKGRSYMYGLADGVLPQAPCR